MFSFRLIVFFVLTKTRYESLLGSPPPLHSVISSREDEKRPKFSTFHKKHLTAFNVHYFMLTVIILKALNLRKAKDKSIKLTGSAHGRDVLFYIFSFLKGIMLFTLIGLTGWSFLKSMFLDNGLTSEMTWSLDPPLLLLLLPRPFWPRFSTTASPLK